MNEQENKNLFDIGYGYDALGRLTLKNRPLLVNAGMVTGMISYSYDMRGWLKSIGTNSFWEQLFYADGSGTRCYNGNISSIKWRDNSSSTIRGYRFTYDSANRLTDGDYAEGDAQTSNTLTRGQSPCALEATTLVDHGVGSSDCF